MARSARGRLSWPRLVTSHEAAPRPSPEEGAQPGAPRVRSGAVRIVVAHDLGTSLDLASASELLAAAGGSARSLEGPTRSAAARFRFDAASLEVAGRSTEPAFEATLHASGGLSLCWTIPFEGELEELVDLSARLSDRTPFVVEARAHAARILEWLGDAVEEPRVSEVAEDYVIVHVESFEEPLGAAELCERHAGVLARILRSEAGRLSEEEMRSALEGRVSYGRSDAAVVDWSVAFVFDRDRADFEIVRSVLEFVNLQLVEMRGLDDELDRSLERASSALAAAPGRFRGLLSGHSRRELYAVARMQVDGALLFERVGNTLKVVGDPYLVRIHREAVRRFGLGAWDVSVQRKLGAIGATYDKLHDHASARRLELLEWIIIWLIAVSIVLPFLGAPK